MDKFFDFLEEHWAGLWVAVSCTGLAVSIMYSHKWVTIAVWVAILIASLITVAEKWEDFFEGLGKLLYKALSGAVSIAIGEKGLSPALLTDGTILFLLSVFVIMPAGNKDGALIGAVGVVSIIVGIIYPIATNINKSDKKKKKC